MHTHVPGPEDCKLGPPALPGRSLTNTVTSGQFPQSAALHATSWVNRQQMLKTANIDFAQERNLRDGPIGSQPNRKPEEDFQDEEFQV